MLIVTQRSLPMRMRMQHCLTAAADTDEGVYACLQVHQLGHWCTRVCGAKLLDKRRGVTEAGSSTGNQLHFLSTHAMYFCSMWLAWILLDFSGWLFASNYTCSAAQDCVLECY